MPRKSTNRTALALTSGFTIILLVNAAFVFMARQRDLRLGLEHRATSFAQVTSSAVYDLYTKYYESGRVKFNDRLRSYLQREPSVDRMLLTDMNGKVLVDSLHLTPPFGQEVDTTISEPAHLKAIKNPEVSLLRLRDPSGRETLTVVTPYFEDWGRHQYSVTYHVSYDVLKPAMARLLQVTSAQLLLSILACILVVATCLRRAAQPAPSIPTP